MKFVLGNGEQLREKLQNFPEYWSNFFAASKLLVIGVVNDDTIAAYGVRGILNLVTIYVKEGHRGRGISWQMSEKAINIARKRHFHFLTSSVSFHHNVALHRCSKLGYRIIKRLKKRKSVVMVRPLTAKGNLTYIFLRIACSMLPGELLAQVAEWALKRTYIKSGSKDVQNF